MDVVTKKPDTGQARGPDKPAAPSKEVPIDLAGLRASRVARETSATSTAKLSPTGVGSPPVRDFRERIQPNRIHEGQARAAATTRKVSRRGETRAERETRKSDADVRRERQRREQAIRQVRDERVEERSADSALATKGDPKALTNDVEGASRLDPKVQAELSQEVVDGSVAKLGVDAQAVVAADAGASLENGLATTPEASVAQEQELKTFTYTFASRGFSHTDLHHVMMSFFANVDPVDLDEREKEEILAKINSILAGELTPQKIMLLKRFEAICEQAQIRVDERVREMGENAPATAEEIGAIMRKILKLCAQADEIAFDPSNN